MICKNVPLNKIISVLLHIHLWYLLNGHYINLLALSLKLFQVVTANWRLWKPTTLTSKNNRGIQSPQRGNLGQNLGTFTIYNQSVAIFNIFWLFFRWLRPIRGFENLQPWPQDIDSHRRLERRFKKIQSFSSRCIQKKNLYPKCPSIFEVKAESSLQLWNVNYYVKS